MADNLQLLDQDLLNYSQLTVPIHSLSPKWLWCEAWCDKKLQDKSYIIDLCGDPHLHIDENKLDKYQRLQPELYKRYTDILNNLFK